MFSVLYSRLVLLYVCIQHIQISTSIPHCPLNLSDLQHHSVSFQIPDFKVTCGVLNSSTFLCPFDSSWGTPKIFSGFWIPSTLSGYTWATLEGWCSTSWSETSSSQSSGRVYSNVPSTWTSFINVLLKRHLQAFWSTYLSSRSLHPLGQKFIFGQLPPPLFFFFLLFSFFFFLHKSQWYPKCHYINVYIKARMLLHSLGGLTRMWACGFACLCFGRFGLQLASTQLHWGSPPCLEVSLPS